MLKASTQKFLITCVTLGGIASLGGTWFYLPHRQEKLEQIVEKDHDVIIRIENDVHHIKSKVEQLEKKLERNGIVYQYENWLTTNDMFFR